MMSIVKHAVGRSAVFGLVLVVGAVLLSEMAFAGDDEIVIRITKARIEANNGDGDLQVAVSKQLFIDGKSATIEEEKPITPNWVECTKEGKDVTHSITITVYYCQNDPCVIYNGVKHCW